MANNVTHQYVAICTNIFANKTIAKMQSWQRPRLFIEKGFTFFRFLSYKVMNTQPYWTRCPWFNKSENYTELSNYIGPRPTSPNKLYSYYFINPSMLFTPYSVSVFWLFGLPEGANPAMPHRSWQWSLAPSVAERIMITLWICWNVRVSPRTDVGYGFGPRLRKKIAQ